MIPVSFPEANNVFGPPPGYDESQVMSIPACIGRLRNPHSHLDGQNIVVVAWKPTEAEIQELQNGANVYLCCFDALPPHCMGTSFKAVTGEV